MISVSNPRRGSSLLLGLGLCLWPLWSLGQTQLEFVPQWHGNATTEAWRVEDQAWLSTQSPLAWQLAGAVDTLADSPPDSLRTAVLGVISALLKTGGGQADAGVVQTPTQGLRARWLERGYLGVTLRTFGVDAVTRVPSRLELDPGPRYTYAEIQVAGDDFPDRTHLITTWLPRPGDAVSVRNLEVGIDRLLAGAGEAGFPFARWVTGDLVVDPATATVVVKATLLSGKLSYIGPVTSSLPRLRARNFLVRASGLSTGDVLRQSDLVRATDRLMARDLYARVDEPQVYLTSSPDTVGIFFPVVPRRKVNRLQVVLGVSREAETGASRISGEVDLRLPDLAGTGRSLRVGWRDDGNKNSRFGLSYAEPLAFGTPLDTDFALDHEVEKDTYTRFRLENRWRLPVVAYWGIELGVGWDRSTYPVGSLERTSRVRGRGAILHRRGDRTRSGWSGLFAIETAVRKSSVRPLDEDTGLTNSQLGESISQRILEGDLGGEQWLGATLSLAARGAFRQLTGGAAEAPLSEQFRFGGAATLRGYREDEFHGTRVSYGSLELRIGRPGASRLYTFYDLGYFEFSVLEPTTADPARRVLKRDWPRGYGLGLLARTAAGDISLAVGFPGTVDFNLAKLHVTLMETF